MVAALKLAANLESVAHIFKLSNSFLKFQTFEFLLFHMFKLSSFQTFQVVIHFQTLQSFKLSVLVLYSCISPSEVWDSSSAKMEEMWGGFNPPVEQRMEGVMVSESPHHLSLALTTR